MEWDDRRISKNSSAIPNLKLVSYPEYSRGSWENFTVDYLKQSNDKTDLTSNRGLSFYQGS